MAGGHHRRLCPCSQHRGPRVAVLALLCLLFILVNGPPGGSHGLVAARGDRRAVLLPDRRGARHLGGARRPGVGAARPICDTLQTMPIFVFLIPVIMVFLVGEFSAHRHDPLCHRAVDPLHRARVAQRAPEIVEAARAMGAGRLQRLRQVELPLALPEIMLGLNQTIMMALAMVVVAALVGARGLGATVMVAQLGQCRDQAGLGPGRRAHCHCDGPDHPVVGGAAQGGARPWLTGSPASRPSCSRARGRRAPMGRLMASW